MRRRSVDWFQTRFEVYVFFHYVYWVQSNSNLAMRRVLHLKMVKQCAMLEEFGIFLVLADKVRSFLSFLIIY